MTNAALTKALENAAATVAALSAHIEKLEAEENEAFLASLDFAMLTDLPAVKTERPYYTREDQAARANFFRRAA